MNCPACGKPSFSTSVLCAEHSLIRTDSSGNIVAYMAYFPEYKNGNYWIPAHSKMIEVKR